MADEIKQMADSVFVAVKSYIDGALAIFDEKIASIPAGKDGEKGEKGDWGEKGIDGKQGERGADGNHGKDGRDGVDGKDGAPGERGADGVNGTNGNDGQHGEKGLDGLPGAEGPDGRDGRDGKDGAPGRDAVRIQIQDGIDGTRSYPLGTYAAYRGGMVCAQRLTDPLVQEPDIAKAGWLVVLEGLADFQCATEDGGRVDVKTITLTSGRTLVQKNKTHMMIQRGLFELGKDYERGDTVTSQGSQWHCEKPTSKSPELDPGSWKLIAKKGRDGRDAESVKAPPFTTVKLR